MCFASCPFFPESKLCGPPFCMFVFSLDFPFFLELCFFFEIWNPTHTTPQNRKKWFSGIFGPRPFFTGSVSLFVFVFWLRKFLSATKATKNRKTSKKNKKKTKDSEECLGQGLCSEELATKKSTTTFFGSRYKNNNRNEWHKNTGFTEMWEPIYGMIAFVFLCCVFPLLSIPDR